MIVELLYVDGCPSYERLLPTVRCLARQAGAELLVRRVGTPAAADPRRFLGSPTVRVDGVDIRPARRGARRLRREVPDLPLRSRPVATAA